MIGRFRDISRDIFTGKYQIVFDLDAVPLEEIEKIRNVDLLNITVKPYKKKRSLSANAYFHVLCDKLRQVLGMSMARCKNHLIADYGQIEYIQDQPMIYKTNAPEDYMLELETIHTKCVRVTEEKGHPVYYYRIYRGSHTYDSKEFSQLLEGTINECKEQGIETLPPVELERMVNCWKA